MSIHSAATWCAVALLALSSFGCMCPEVQSDFIAAGLKPSEVVDGVRAGAALDLSRIRKLVIAIPQVGDVDTAGLDGLNPASLAGVFQELLVEELCPDVDAVYVVRHVDQPLVSVKDLTPQAHKIKTLLPTDERLKHPAPDGDVGVVETRIVTLDPGSKWQRYVIGCGAGMTTVQIDGRLRALGASDPLLEWRDRTGSWVPRGPVDLFYSDLSRLARRSGELFRAARSGGAL